MAIDLGSTVKELIDEINSKASLLNGNTFSGLQLFKALENISKQEQTTVKILTSNGGSITFGKEAANSGTMIRLDQVDGTCRLRFRSSATAGAMVWEQPEQGAQLYIDLGKNGADKHRISFPSKAGTLALTSQIPTKLSELTNDSGFTKNAGTVTSIKINSDNSESLEINESEIITESGTVNLHRVAKTGKYTDLLDKLTSVDGLGGGTLTGALKITGGDQPSAAKIALNESNSGQITDSSTGTIFGFMNSTDLTIGSSKYNMRLRGKETRPQYNAANLALFTDVANTTTHSQTQLTDEDLNTLYGDDKVGWYFANSGNTCTNKPSTTGKPFSLQVIKAGQQSTTLVYIQEYIEAVLSATAYLRLIVVLSSGAKATKWKEIPLQIPDSHDIIAVSTTANLNDLYDSSKGIWRKGATGNTCTNKPSDVDAFYLYAAPTDNPFQFLIANQKLYYRFKVNSTWQGWQMMNTNTGSGTIVGQLGIQDSSEENANIAFKNVDGDVMATINYDNTNNRLLLNDDLIAMSDEVPEIVANNGEATTETLSTLKIDNTNYVIGGNSESENPIIKISSTREIETNLTRVYHINVALVSGKLQVGDRIQICRPRTNKQWTNETHTDCRIRQRYACIDYYQVTADDVANNYTKFIIEANYLNNDGTVTRDYRFSYTVDGTNDKKRMPLMVRVQRCPNPNWGNHGESALSKCYTVSNCVPLISKYHTDGTNEIFTLRPF